MSGHYCRGGSVIFLKLLIASAFKYSRGEDKY